MDDCLKIDIVIRDTSEIDQYLSTIYDRSGDIHGLVEVLSDDEMDLDGLVCVCVRVYSRNMSFQLLRKKF